MRATWEAQEQRYGPTCQHWYTCLGTAGFYYSGWIAAIWIYSRSIAWEQILFILLVLDTVCTPEQGTNARIVDLLAKKEKTMHGKYIFDAFGVKFSFFSISRQRLDSANLKEKVTVRLV